MIEKTVGRPQLVVQAEPSPQAPHAALLVDFDNVTMGIRSDLQTQLRKLLNSAIIRGKVSVQRAYADWRRYPQYIVPLTEASIDLIFAPAVGANKKNATDIRLAIDALELVFTRPEIGTFILLSGDSDFSALVLKLKEYGKFVIGVGIRESSSDLLVQNCDEYYSYNELTGLARTGETEIVRHDPWELVVEAVQKMLRNDDVMRSDRLKQVMQSIDPNFDEKDVGCNRFNKFVVEAEKRGLLRLTKMENGQHAVDVGPNANVRIEQETSAEQKPTKPEATSASSQRRKRSTRSRSERDTKVRTLTLSESIELLKRALVAAGAVGDEATVADRARERMIEIHGSESDPVFEIKRFQRLLRQAHDADAIELIKSGDDDYMLKLSAAAVAEMESEKVAAESTAEEPKESKEETAEDTEATAKPKRTTKKKSPTARKSSRSRARAAAKEQPDDEAAAASADPEEKLSGEETEKPKRTTRRKTTATKKTTRSRTKKTTEETPDEVTSTGSDADESGAGTEPASAEKETVKPAPRRKKTTRSRAKKTEEEGSAEVANEATIDDGTVKSIPAAKVESPAASLNPRYRKGSRTVAPKPPVTENPAEAEAKATEPAKPTPKASTGPRTLGVRSGSRGAKRPEKELSKDATADSESPKPPTEELKPPKEEAKLPKAEPQLVTEAPKPEPMPTSKPEAKPEASVEKPKVETKLAKKAESSNEADDDGAGLFRKVTAAFQRAMGTGKEDSE